jgi:hypothetical protein
VEVAAGRMVKFDRLRASATSGSTWTALLDPGLWMIDARSLAGPRAGGSAATDGVPAPEVGGARGRAWGTRVSPP